MQGGHDGVLHVDALEWWLRHEMAAAWVRWQDERSSFMATRLVCGRWRQLGVLHVVPNSHSIRVIDGYR